MSGVFKTTVGRDNKDGFKERTLQEFRAFCFNIADNIYSRFCELDKKSEKIMLFPEGPQGWYKTFIICTKITQIVDRFIKVKRAYDDYECRNIRHKLNYLNEVVNKLEEQEESEITIWINPEFPIRTNQNEFLEKEVRPLLDKLDAIRKQLQSPTFDSKYGLLKIKVLIADKELIDYLKLCCEDLSEIFSSFWNRVNNRTFYTDGWSGYNHITLHCSNDVIEVKDE